MKKIKVTAVDREINHPEHYTSSPSGVECIQVVEHMTFNAGNAVKYLWRAGLKVPERVADEKPLDSEVLTSKIKDLKKAAWYVAREIERLEKSGGGR